MKHSVSKVIGLAIALMTILALAACSATPTPQPTTQPTAAATQAPTATPTEAPKPVTLNIANMWSGTDPKTPVYQAAWAQFQKDNPNVTLKVDELPSDGYADKENTWAATGEMPDIVLSDVGQQAKQFVDAGVAMDLTPFFDADPAWKNSFVPGIFNADAMFNGKIYFMPNEYYNYPLWCDNVVMQKLGITAPVTWDDFMADLQKAKDAGYYGLYMPNSTNSAFGNTLIPIMAGASGQATVDAWNKAVAGTGKFSDPNIIEVYKKFQALAPFVTPNANAVDSTTIDVDFLAHKYLFEFRGPWQIAKYNKLSPDFDKTLTFTSIPYIDPASKGFTPTGIGMEWMLNAKLDSDQAAAAVKLLKYLVSPDVSLQYLYAAQEDNGTVLPPYDTTKIGSGLAQCMDLLKNLPASLQNAPTCYPTYATSDANTQAVTVTQELLDNKITPEQAATEMDQASASK